MGRQPLRRQIMKKNKIFFRWACLVLLLIFGCGPTTVPPNAHTATMDTMKAKQRIDAEIPWEGYDFLEAFFIDELGKAGYRAVKGKAEPFDFHWRRLKVGFLNGKDSLVIPPQFEKAKEFSEGYAAVMKAGKWGLIDMQGQQVLDFQYENLGEADLDFAGTMQEGLIVAQANNLLGFIDAKGNWIIAAQFLRAQSFREGKAWVQFPNKKTWSLIDKAGKLLGHTNFEIVQPFFEGKAAVLPQGGIWSITDAQLKTSPLTGFSKKISYLNSFSEGLALVVLEDNRIAFAGLDGKKAFDAEFSTGSGFSFGRAAVAELLPAHWHAAASVLLGKRCRANVGDSTDPSKQRT